MSDMIRIIHNATVITDWRDPQLHPKAAVAWKAGRVLAVGDSFDVLQRYPLAECTDAEGRLLTPGLINAHHHIYSALAAGISPDAPVNNFMDCLEQLWWRLDRALDEDSVRVSARLTALRAIRSGCTAIVDHHSSPNFISSSLDCIASELVQAGLSAVLCYETSDRNGHEVALQGLKENLDFAERHQDSEFLRGMIGLHALFTLDDSTLDVARAGVARFGCHLHLAEDRVDDQICRDLHGKGLLDRLEQFELLGDKSLFVHGIHLSGEDRKLLAESGSWLVLNPESNANNQVGLPVLRTLAAEYSRLLLGTDGMCSDMLTTLRSSFLLQRATDPDPASGWSGHDGLLAANADFLAKIFGDPLRGRLAGNGYADLVVWEYVPGRGMMDSNRVSHLVYGAAQHPARHTVSQGKWLMKDFEICTLDEDRIHTQVGHERGELWNRFRETPSVKLRREP